MRATLLALLIASTAVAQEPRLGTVNFPTSGSAPAQRHFLRGVGYLHSFEYDLAAQAFREAQRAEPGFAMAYWGEAMTLNHPVWNRQATDSARAVLQRLAPTPDARSSRAGSDRERAWLEAIEQLYGEGSKPRRDTLYLRAMLRMAEQYPDDHEVSAFTALAWLGLNQAVRATADYMRAAALVQPVFEANPDHPGAVHYLIHAYDDPLHASLGLRAARAYSRIAPDAAHAQHMTTHIFFALGMWEEGRAQNEIAASQTRWVPGHYTWWLGYALLQQGRYADALRHLERVRSGMGRGTPGQIMHLTWMRGEYLVNTERWRSPPAGWEVVTISSMPSLAVYDNFVRAYADWRQGRRIDSAAIGMSRLVRATAGTSEAPEMRTLHVMRLQIEGLARYAAGDSTAGVRLVGEAAALERSLPLEFGPPRVVKPSHELLGDLLLARRQYAEAQREYTRALELAPGRARALLGLIRAARGAGDEAVAQDARRQLDAAWRGADADVSVSARTESDRAPGRP